MSNYPIWFERSPSYFLDNVGYARCGIYDRCICCVAWDFDSKKKLEFKYNNNFYNVEIPKQISTSIPQINNEIVENMLFTDLTPFPNTSRSIIKQKFVFYTPIDMNIIFIVIRYLFPSI